MLMGLLAPIGTTMQPLQSGPDPPLALMPVRARFARENAQLLNEYRGDWEYELSGGKGGATRREGVVGLGWQMAAMVSLGGHIG